MKKIVIIGTAILGMFSFVNSYADTATNSSVASTIQTGSNAASQNNGQGNGNTIISNSTNPDRISETVRNVSAGVLGAFASTGNQFNCTYTKAGINGAGPGASLTFQWSKNDTDFCVKGWTQAELARQATITDDTEVRNKLLQASINVKCSLDDDIYQAMVVAGLKCQMKPDGYDDRTHKVVVAPNVVQTEFHGKTVTQYAKAQVD